MLKGTFQRDAIFTTATPLTATGNSAAVQTGNYQTVVAYITVSAISGTGTPTLNCKFQDSPDGTTWYDIASGAFTAITTTSGQRLVLNNVGPYLRAATTITGTTPSLTTDLQVIGAN